MTIVGRAKYTLTHARMYFARPTIAIAKIRDYSQSNSVYEACARKMFIHLFIYLLIIYLDR